MGAHAYQLYATERKPSLAAAQTASVMLSAGATPTAVQSVLHGEGYPVRPSDVYNLKRKLVSSRKLPD